MAETTDPVTKIVAHHVPDGSNNWYKNNVNLTFQVSDESGISKLYYRWDEAVSWSEYETIEVATPETLSIVAEGGEIEATLEQTPVYPESLKLYRNTFLLVQNTDYVVDIETGAITIITPIIASNVVKAHYNSTSSIEDEILITHAIGTETTANLAQTHIVEDTFELKINSVPVLDYAIDYSTGELTFAQLSPNDTLTASYSYIILGASVPVVGESYVASGGEVTANLDNSPVTSASEKIYLNGIAINRGSDYTINYIAGIISFSSELSPQDEITADYEGELTGSTIVASAEAGQVNALISNIPIVDDSFIIYNNLVPLRRYAQYVLESTEGTITLSNESFPSGLSASNQVKAKYDFNIYDEITVKSATSGQTNFNLFEAPVQIGSLRLTLNGVKLIENDAVTKDFSVNYATGAVILTVGMATSDIIKADYIASSESYETVILSAAGGETILTLDHKNVIADTLDVLLGASSLDNEPEFTLDVETGEIAFTTGLTATDVITCDYSYYITNESVLTASGGETSWTLANKLIVNPYVVNKNASLLVEGSDYEIDWMTGVITFTDPLVSGDTITADYNYNFSVYNELVIKKAFTTNLPLVGGSTLAVYKNAILLDQADYSTNLVEGLFSFNIPILTTDIITTTYYYGKSAFTGPETFLGAGSSYTTTNKPLVIGSVTILKNPSATLLTEFTDYTLNYATGEITLTIPLLGAESIDVSYFYGAPLAIPNEGIHAIEFYSEDNVGNKENVKRAEFKYDEFPPTTVADIPAEFSSEPMTINFLASDNMSGVERTFFTTDGTIPSTSSPSGTSTVVDTSGDITLQYFSVDFAGNEESVNISNFIVDINSTDQVVSIQESFSINGNNGYYRSSPEITIIANNELDLDKIFYKLVSSDELTTAKYTSIVDLTAGIDLSNIFYIKIQIDQGSEYQIDLRGNTPATTTITEILETINTTTRVITTVTNENSLTDGTFKLVTANDNVVSVGKLSNLTTGESYTYYEHSGNLITFVGTRAPSTTDVMAVDYEYSSANIAYETDATGGDGTGYITIVSPTAGTGSATAEIRFIEPLSADATEEVFGLDETLYPHIFIESQIFAEYTGGFTLPLDGKYNLKAFAKDLDGNTSSESSKNYQLDSSVPVTTVSIIGGVMGTGGYYTSNPTIRFESNDLLSGVQHILYKWDSITPPFIEYVDTRPEDDSTQIPSEGEHTLYYYSTDRAGNQESIHNMDFELDSVAPTTTDNSSNIVASAIDINRLKISKATGPNATLTISNEIMTFAGTEPAGPFDLRYFTLEDIKDAINSYSSTGYACAIETDFSNTTEADHQPASLLFDVSGLVISSSFLSPTRIYSGVGVKLYASDSTSGVNDTYYEITEDGSTPPDPTNLSTSGLSLVSNESVMIRPSGTWSFNTIAVGGEVDAKVSNQPIHSLSLIKNPGANPMVESIDYTLEYNTGKITLTSGLSAGQSLEADYVHGSLIVLDSDAIYKIKYRSEDLAGNLEVVKDLDNSGGEIEITRNLPTIDFVPDIIAEPSGWFISDPNITINAISVIPATITQLFYRWGTDAYTTVAGASVVVSMPSDGQHTLDAYTIDSFNRVSAIKTEIFKKDIVAPTTTDDTLVSVANELVLDPAGGGEVNANFANPHIIVGSVTATKNGVPLTLGVDYSINYVTGAMTFLAPMLPLILNDSIVASYDHAITSSGNHDVTLTITDSSPASGTYRTYYEIGTVSSPPTNPTIASSYESGSPVTITLTTSEEFIIKYFSQDIAGNNESVKQTEVVRVDKDLPVTTLQTIPSIIDGLNSYFVTPITINFAVNAGSSLLRITYYRLDSSDPFIQYVTPFAIVDGVYDIEYYSEDLAGNIEAVQTTQIKQDTQPPVTSDSIPTVFVGDSTITLNPVDVVAGIDKTYYQILDDVFLNPINSTSVVGEVVAVLAAPVSTIRVTNPFVISLTEIVYQDGVPLTVGLHYTFDYDYGIITFLAPLTGTFTADYSYAIDLDGLNQGSTFQVTAEGNYIVKYFSIDLAGNIEIIKTAPNILRLDLTPPIVTNILPTDMLIDDLTEEISFRVQDAGSNPSGIDPFSIRVFVDNIEYSLLRNSQHISMSVVGTAYSNIIDDTTTSINEVLLPSAIGGEYEFQFSNIPVAFGTQKVYKNTELLEPDIDYAFNPTLGQLVLIAQLEEDDHLEAEYRYITAFHNIYDVSLSSNIAYTESFAGSGVPVTYFVANPPIVTNSIYIEDAGTPLNDGSDYNVVLATGQINLVIPTTGSVDVTYKTPIGPLRSTIPNFDVIDILIIDPMDTGGNVSDPIVYDFVEADIEPPYLTELNPRPNAKDVSIYTNVMFHVLDNDAGVDIQTVNVNVNGTDFSIQTKPAIEIQYVGPGSTATATIVNKNLITRVNGQVDVNFSFLNINYDTVQKVVTFLNSLPTYTATLLDTDLSQESSQTLISIREVGIKVPTVLNAKLIFDTRFTFIEQADGYLITITPESIFDNQTIVNVIIDASDNEGNAMPTVEYGFQTQLGASTSISNQLELANESDVILARMFDGLASNYNTDVEATEFTVFMRLLSNELARFKIQSELMLQDYYLPAVRDALLYQNFGVLVNFLASDIISQDTYRSFLISILSAYYAGSTKESVESAISLFTDGNVYVRERYLEFPNDLSEQFVFDVLVEIGSTSAVKSLIELLNRDLNGIIRDIKPAHTFFLLGFLFREELGINSGCNYVPLYDIYGAPVLDGGGHQLNENDNSAYQIFKNGEPLIEIRDFLLSTSTGLITFIEPLIAGDVITADYKEKHVVANESVVTITGATTINTVDFPIVPLSYKFYKNETRLKERIDYYLNMVTGEITLLVPLINIDQVVLHYSWFIQVFDETVIASAVGGETQAYIAFSPVVDYQFNKGEKVSQNSICDRRFWHLDRSLVPYVDFKLNGKSKFFTLNDPASLLNDIAQLVATNWVTEEDIRSYKLDYTENAIIEFPAPIDIENWYYYLPLSDTYTSVVDDIFNTWHFYDVRQETFPITEDLGWSGSIYKLNQELFPLVQSEVDMAYAITQEDHIIKPIIAVAQLYPFIILSENFDQITDQWTSWDIDINQTEQFPPVSESFDITMLTNQDDVFPTELIADIHTNYRYIKLEDTFEEISAIWTEWNMVFDFIEEFTEPVIEHLILIAQSFADEFKTDLVSDELNTIYESSQNESFPSPTDSVSIVLNFVSNEEFPQANEIDHSSSLYTNQADIMPEAIDQPFIAQSRFFIDEFEGPSFWLPDTQEQDSFSYLTESRLNQTHELFSKKYRDQLITLTLL